MRKNRLSRVYSDFEPSYVEAKKYWSDQLHGQTIITVPQDKECQISVVVPVHNEDLEIILRQLRSISLQDVIDAKQFEVIYVVNNSPSAAPEVISKNAEILRLPIWKNHKNVLGNENYSNETKKLLEKLRHFNLFVIDKSSPGNEIVDCNVGKVRNIGIAEASLRFYTNDIDGLIFQIDADSYYPDPTYFSRVLNQFKEDPKLIALCGGVRLYCDAEKFTDEQKEKLRPEVSLLCNYLRWKSLKFLLLGKSFVFDDDFMSGPNMITKSFPSAAVHGVPDVRRAEDVAFGERLQSYAKRHNLEYSFDGAKDLFQVFSLLRLSGGLSNNLGSSIKTDDSGLTYTYDESGKLVFKEFPNYETAKIGPIPILYDKFKKLALKSSSKELTKQIDKIEEKVELNEQFLLRQLS